MQRILSIFFLAVFTFQVAGHYIIFWAMNERAQSEMLVRLDAGHYSQDDVFVLTIPLNLPYPITESADYERVNGDFLYDGTIYKLVKQKLSNDTLFVVCLKDRNATKIAEAFNDFTRLSQDVPPSNKKAVSFITKLNKDYRSTEFKIIYSSRLLFEETFLAFDDASVEAVPLNVNTPPPKQG